MDGTDGDPTPSDMRRLAQALRWLLAYWAAVHGEVFLADWDESDAFCNIPREDTSDLLADIAPRLGCWIRQYYGYLRIRTATPHGLTDAYAMLHGGGQGDSGGVGAYLAVGIQRTRCHRGIVVQHRDPRDPSRPSADHPGAYPAAPHDLNYPILEIVYSDDRRPLALTGRSLEQLLNVMCHACWAAGGSVNTNKLQAFHLVLRDGRLRYTAGAIHPITGRIPFTRGGLMLAGVPLVMGERSNAILQKVLKRLTVVRAGVLRLLPSYVLSLRIVLGYAVSQLDFVHAACPPDGSALRPLQILLDSICTGEQGPSNDDTHCMGGVQSPAPRRYRVRGGGDPCRPAPPCPEGQYTTPREPPPKK